MLLATENTIIGGKRQGGKKEKNVILTVILWPSVCPSRPKTGAKYATGNASGFGLRGAGGGRDVKKLKSKSEKLKIMEPPRGVFNRFLIANQTK